MGKTILLQEFRLDLCSSLNLVPDPLLIDHTLIQEKLNKELFWYSSNGKN